jgi:hypothetical protein
MIFVRPAFFFTRLQEAPRCRASRRHRAGLFPSLLAGFEKPSGQFRNRAQFDYRPCRNFWLSHMSFKWCAAGPTNPHTRFCPRRISVQSQVAGTNGEAPTSVGVSFCLGRLRGFRLSNDVNQGSVLASSKAGPCMPAVDKEAAEITVRSFAYSTKAGPPPGRVLSRH